MKLIFNWVLNVCTIFCILVVVPGFFYLNWKAGELFWLSVFQMLGLM